MFSTTKRPLTMPPVRMPSEPVSDKNDPYAADSPDNQRDAAKHPHMMRDGSMKRRRKPKGDAKPFVEWCNQIADQIASVSQAAEEIRVRSWVTLIRRHRGSSLSDNIGVFNQRGTKWLDVDATNIKVLNIVEPLIRANTATMTQTNIALEFAPATSQMKGAASVAEAIALYLMERDITETVKYRIADLTQLASSAFLHSEYFIDEDQDEECGNNGNKMKVPDILDADIVGQGEYACTSCGDSGMFDSADLQNLAKDTPVSTTPDAETPKNLEPTFYCPDCGGEAEILSMPETDNVETLNGFNEQPAGDNRTTLHPSFEIRMDERGTEGGNLAGGDYFEHHFLMRREEIEEIAPHLKLGAPQAPSYSIKWQHALQNGLKTPLAWTDDGKGATGDDLFEVRAIYLKPKRFRSYIAPSDYHLRDAETGENIWSISANETVRDAIMNNGGEHLLRTRNSKDGICFWLVDKQLMKPPFFADFTKEWSIIQFAPDAFSAWARCFNIILPIQETINDLNTIKITHLEKNSIANVVIDTEQFDLEDFENDLIGTKTGTARERPISDYFAVVSPPNLGSEADGWMQFLLAMKADLSGVQPAQLGAAQSGQPYAAQLLQVNQSQGMLTPVFKSWAHGIVMWAQHQLEIVQANWSEEQFEYIQSRYGDEWKDSDIQDFLECKISRDVLISYVQGTEIPKTLQQKEAKLQQFFAQISQLASLAPGAVTEQQFQEVIGQLASYADLDFDAGNYEGEHRLASVRLERLNEAIQLFHQNGFTVQPDPATGEYPIDPESGLSALAMAAKHIIKQARCEPVAEAENHKSHKEFWADNLRALAADPEADELAIAVYVEMWHSHSEAAVEMAQLTVQDQIDANAPAEAHQQQLQQQQMQGQQQMQMAQQQQAAQGKTGELEAAMAQKQSEIDAAAQEEDGADAEGAQQADQQAAESAAARDHETTHKMMDLTDAERQRQHELELAAMQQNGNQQASNGNAGNQ